MSLRRRRAEVEAQTREVQALRARSGSHARGFAHRLRELWPWLWISGGAVLGIALERELDRRPRTRSSLPVAWLTALPWGLVVPLIERALAAAEAGRNTPTPPSDGSAGDSP
jgi:hypothetical protein